MPNLAIKVENLRKKYVLTHQTGGRGGQGTLRDAITDGFNSVTKHFKKNSKTADPGHEDFWAVNDVSFEINPGDRVGIIGRNGAGKSTLLKILSRITEPTQGRITIEGRIASLLEVGTGFHPELTGRENIFLNGAILGMSKVEIKRKFDEIVAFSEVEKFLDTPVKRYSSGMYVRLAFAVAAHLEPEILIVDEVLAVGDIAFQKKCLGKMKDISDSHSRTVLFVSHSMAAIESLCDSAIVMDKGTVKFKGDVNTATKMYLSSFEETIEDDLTQVKAREGNGKLRFTKINFEGDFTDNDSVAFGKPVNIVIHYQANTEMTGIHLTMGFFDQQISCISWFSNKMMGVDFDLSKGAGKLICSIDKMPILPGDYFIGLHAEANFETLDWVQIAKKFTVAPSDFYGSGIIPTHGVITIPHLWNHSLKD